MKAINWISVLPLTGVLACFSGSTSDRSVVVFHTQNAIVSAALPSSSSADTRADAGGSSASSSDRLRERVRGLFPAACLDTDRDDDGLPDSQDHSFDDDTTAESADDSDGGSSSDSLRCRRCNRGPGKSGDFRYEELAGNASLERGRVVSRSSTTLVVAGPKGPITLELTSSSKLDTSHGEITPGAEIRADGALRTGASRTFEVADLEVLCPGPGVVPDADLPTDVPLAPVSQTDVIN